MIAGNADAVFARLCDAMDRPDLARDLATHEARAERQDPLDDEIAAWTATMTADELIALLRAHDVPVGLINPAPDLATDPHILGRDMIVRLAAGFAGDVPMTGVVPKFSRTPGEIRARRARARRAHRRGAARARASAPTRRSRELRDGGVVA